MARRINEQRLQVVADLVAEHPDGISRADLQAAYETRTGEPIGRRTLQRWLAQLIEEHCIEPIGEGPAVRYRPVEETPATAETMSDIRLDISPSGSEGLLDDLRRLIDETRAAVAATVNAGLTMLYWRIGLRINDEILQGERAEYGKQIVATLAQQLTEEYGRGYTEKSLRRMMQFASVFPDESIVATLSRQLSWSHFRELLPLEKPLQRDFYAEMCRIERWSVRTLRDKIDSMLYERTALSKKPEALIREELDALRDQDRLSPDLVFRDPYFLDFLGLRDRYLERDLEDAILRELEQFLLELGAGFSFIARQQRITVDGDDYYLDLLFFHRGLRRLIAIDLKLGAFRPADKGQMELYLRWLDRYERQPGEEAPLGLILCAGKKQETIELLALEESGIRVAEYLTDLPPRAVLVAQLHHAIENARARFQHRLPGDDAAETS